MATNRTFGGLAFEFKREDQWGTYWERGELGMVFVPKRGTYQCYTTETDVEGNPLHSWEGDDPDKLVAEARTYFLAYIARLLKNLTPDLKF